MCGRFTLRTPLTVLVDQFHFDVDNAVQLSLRYNIAPTQDVAAVRLVEGKRKLALLRWGLIPSWASVAAQRRSVHLWKIIHQRGSIPPRIKRRLAAKIRDRAQGQIAGTSMEGLRKLMVENGLKAAGYGKDFTLKHVETLVKGNVDVILNIKPKGATGSLTHAVVVEDVITTAGGKKVFQIADPGDARRWLVPEDELLQRFTGWLLVSSSEAAKKVGVIK